MSLGSRIFILFFFVAVTTRLFAQNADEEWIKAYFNMPAYTPDSSLAVNDRWDLISTLENLIDSATSSIDLCIYDFEHPDIAHALVRAKQRGVQIRIITDNHNRNDSRELDAYIWNTLGSVGIYSLDDDGDYYRSSTDISDFSLVNASADMHNKFAIFDRLSTPTSDDIVWTGSTNLTYTGAYNTNNVLVIKDPDVARVYEEEFNQMWGGKGAEPNATVSRFHKDKLNVSEYRFDVGGTVIEIYFAPVNRDRSKPSVSDRLVALINEEAQHDIKFQAFSITPDIPLSEALWSLSGEEGILLEGIIDPSFYARYRNAGAIWGSDESKTGNRSILSARETRKLHHKTLVIDADNPQENDVAVVVTGSYNFSNNAEFNNDENTIIIFSDALAAQYAADFEGAQKRALGEMQAPAPPVSPQNWYNVYAISDGRQFEIEVFPGFGYPVRLLGVKVPSIFAGTDSSDYFAGPAAEYLRNILEGRKVRISGPDGGEPYASYGSFKAYVQVDINGKPTSLNKIMLTEGYGTFSNAYFQHPDSVAAFKNYAQLADDNSKGIWRRPSSIGKKVPRLSEASKGDAAEVLYPININTADQATLQLLPGIGETYAKRIIEYRLQHGGFKKVEELLEIKGIGERRFERLRPVVTI